MEGRLAKKDNTIIPELSVVISQSVMPRLKRHLPMALNNFVGLQLLPALSEYEHKVETSDYYRSLQDVAIRTRIPPIYYALAIVISGLVVLRAIMKSASNLVTDLIGYAYPFLKTMEYLEQRKNNTLQDSDIQWPSYWMIFGAVKFLDHLKSITKHIPYFTFSKIGFLLWLMHPRTEGATFIYKKYFSPLWKKKEQLETVNKLLQMLKPKEDDDYDGQQTSRQKAYSMPEVFGMSNLFSGGAKTPEFGSIDGSKSSLADSAIHLDSQEIPLKHNPDLAKFMLSLGLAAGALPNPTDSKPVLSQLIKNAQDHSQFDENDMIAFGLD